MNGAANTDADRKALRLAINLSLATGLVMLIIKVGAYLLTGSAATHRTPVCFNRRISLIGEVWLPGFPRRVPGTTPGAKPGYARGRSKRHGLKRRRQGRAVGNWGNMVGCEVVLSYR